jgi:type IV secretion system protein TrbE
LAFAAPKRSYYVRQTRGRRMFDLRLSGAALAVCGASNPDDQKLIERTLESLPPLAEPDAFVRAFLAAKGLTGVDDLFDALMTPAAPANDAGLPIANDLTSPILGGTLNVAS